MTPFFTYVAGEVIKFCIKIENTIQDIDTINYCNLISTVFNYNFQFGHPNSSCYTFNLTVFGYNSVGNGSDSTLANVPYYKGELCVGREVM